MDHAMEFSTPVRITICALAHVDLTFDCYLGLSAVAFVFAFKSPPIAIDLLLTFADHQTLDNASSDCQPKTLENLKLFKAF